MRSCVISLESSRKFSLYNVVEFVRITKNYYSVIFSNVDQDDKIKQVRSLMSVDKSQHCRGVRVYHYFAKHLNKLL